MSEYINNGDWPTCMDRLSETEFRCTLHGWKIRTTQLPIVCGVCASGARQPAPEQGPGAELKQILESIGIRPIQPGKAADGSGQGQCRCDAFAEQMNRWGVAGCRAHFLRIVAKLQTTAAEYGWGDKLKAAAMAVTNGLAFRINWLDPFPGLVEEAIRRAEEKTSAASQASPQPGTHRNEA
jgi:hypothetical protein